MNNVALKDLRQKWGLSQAAMAERMGLHRRWYISLEQGQRELQRWHVLSLERISIDVAIEQQNPDLIVGTLKFILEHLKELDREREGTPKS
ncbi:MAG: helix-turn-helix domain-containing protein [Ferrovibrio sp.]|uniref:helix-turn-helix domain-containing protein n=1 Tax=Ferrovibrio sp. TaxID=1917215 RepID=UPI00261F0A68|nr:helix-turn-helix transcriptional regulator [Ferrovibrio sp.]MCW0232500.1 helix-turn-helix domain-containing protein [Ferrovibrio sp.]